ncbi:MAG: calcium/sodium antiporter [Firmicutes bacterium]|nr:calcium/sodium antiporter [Bacillota bacterium]
MLLNLGLLAVGFVLLIKGADIFVESNVSIAKALKVPSIVIGLTVVAFGTSMPEAVVSVSAALGGSTDIAIGNIVGSNIFNLLGVLGLSAVIKPLTVHFKEIRTDAAISIVAAIALLGMVVLFSDYIPQVASAGFLTVFLIYLFIMIRQALKDRQNGDSVENAENAETAKKSKSIGISIILSIVGIALIIGGGQLTVVNAIEIAYALQLSERVIGLTIVAIGTSLPELITSIVAATKGEHDIAIGNVVGSNIFNILFILGLTGVIMPLSINMSSVVDLGVLIVSSLVFMLFAFTAKRVVRLEGAIMLALYVAYLVFIIFLQA